MEPVAVYIDVLFLVNLTVDYFLLLGAATLRRLSVSRLRLLLGALVGAVYSCAVFFPPLGALFTVAGKLVSSAVIVLVSFPRRSLRGFLLDLTVFHASSALFAGAMLALDLLFHPGALVLSNGEVYVDLSAGTLILASAAAYACLWLFSRLTNAHTAPRRQLTLSVDGRTATLTALTDTGNLLFDPISGAPVIVASLKSVSRLLPDDAAAAFTANDLSILAASPWRTRVSLIPCSTVAGQTVLPAFRPDIVLVDGKKTGRRVVVAVRQDGFDSDYDAVACELDT